MSIEISKRDILAALSRISPYIRTTPTVKLGSLVSGDWQLSLKLEHLQVTGSFKARGAFNVLLAEDTGGGVVAASGGNFGKAVAYAAMVLGIPATIFVPESSPVEKTGQIGQYGADVRVIPGFYDDALAESRKFAATTGHYLVHAFDQHPVVAGQGTIGVEIENDVPTATTLMVAVGGGGLIGGIASWFRSDLRLIGVESEGCPTLFEARRRGNPTEVDVGGVAASSLGAKQVGAHAWFANQWIDDSVIVDEVSILEAQTWIWDTCRIWVEPAAAVTVAALRTRRYRPNDGEQVIALISGANVSLGSV